MRKFIFVLGLLFIGFTSKALPSLDSAKAAVAKTAHEIDTSSNFKMVYKDLSEKIEALARALRIASEHVYEVLIKQQVVNAVTWVIIYVLFFIAAVSFWKGFHKNYKRVSIKEDPWYGDDMDTHFGLLGYLIVANILSLIFAITFVITISETVMGFYNPEYGAMRDIMDFIK